MSNSTITKLQIKKQVFGIILKALVLDYMKKRKLNAETFKKTLKKKKICASTFRTWCQGEHFPNHDNCKKLAKLFDLAVKFMWDMTDVSQEFNVDLNNIRNYKKASTERLNGKALEFANNIAVYYERTYEKKLFFASLENVVLDTSHVK